jgi:hypothetical protein
MKLLSAITGKKMDPMLLVIILLLVAITITALLFLYKSEKKETFSQLGSSLSDSMGDGVRTSWLNADKKTIDAPNTYSRMETNVTRTSPLPESEMLIFNNNRSSPECCPSTYTNSSGCLCATPEQVKYLNAHGGNRTVGGAPNEY